MGKEQETYLKIGHQLEEAIESQLFGKPCFKVGKKAFVCFFENDMVFKLTGESHRKALALEGAQLFDPSKKGRPMKEWVQIPFAHQKKWKKLAQEALEYVGGN